MKKDAVELEFLCFCAFMGKRGSLSPNVTEPDVWTLSYHPGYGGYRIETDCGCVNVTNDRMKPSAFYRWMKDARESVRLYTRARSSDESIPPLYQLALTNTYDKSIDAYTLERVKQKELQ